MPYSTTVMMMNWRSFRIFGDTGFRGATNGKVLYSLQREFIGSMFDWALSGAATDVWQPILA
jgi:hypothetical protein